jgi:hypothetical protein
MNLKYNSSILLHELSQNMNLKYNSSFDVNNKLFCQASIPTSRDQYLNMPSHKTKGHNSTNTAFLMPAFLRPE